MKNLFEIASGTTAGKDHRFSGKNNQDAVYSRITDDFIVGVVCDGCGSSKHSEVGAKIGCRLILQAVADQLHRSGQLQLKRVQNDILAELYVIAKSMGDSLSEVVTDYFLFTTVGVVISDSGASFFSLGDGIIIVNGEITQIGPFPNNEPPYLAYGIVHSSLQDTSPELLQFQINRHIPIGELNSFLIGSDGAVDINRVSNRTLPGKTELVGLISQFWESDRFFNNPDNVNRRFRLINEDHMRPNWETRRVFTESGLLSDDTTILVGRRKRQEKGEV